MKEYDVTWTITETARSPKQACELAFNRLQEHGNDWTWTVQENGIDKKFEVDFEYVPANVKEL